jgi:hypothetical protein
MFSILTKKKGKFMQYFTRKLYTLQQGDPSLQAVKNASKLWDDACILYKNHFENIKNLLSENIKIFAEKTFHDGIIQKIDNSKDGQVVIFIDCSNSPWGSVGQLSLIFKDVRTFDVEGDIVGDDWLYEEIYFQDDNYFDYQVLLGKSEFRIVARDIIIKST